MTEQEWHACKQVSEMVNVFRRKISDRKRRLFAVASCRRIWHYLTRDESRRTVETAELNADGLATRDDLFEARETAAKIAEDLSNHEPRFARSAAFAAAWVAAGRDKCLQSVEIAIRIVVQDAANQVFLGIERLEGIDAALSASKATERQTEAAEHAALANLFRDIVGNPFRPVSVDSSCLTSTVRTLAHSIYDERAFDRMPILADALEEARCTDADLLAHCRGPGPHVRGCWVVDLLLGKE